MNRKTALVAVAGVLAVPVIAYAQTANVTLYGRVNLDYEIVNGRQADGSNPNVNRLSSNSSRFGLRGVEALGGGLSAIFQIESSVVADASGGTLAARETYLGLQGDWGTVKLGNFLSPYYDYIHPTFGNVPTLLTTILSTGALWAGGGGGLTTATGSFQNRAGNSVRYDSPSYSGFNGSVEYDTRETANHAGIISIGGAYANGPLQLGTAYTRNRQVRGADLDDSAFSATAAYKFDIVRVAGVYEHLDYEVASGHLKRDFWGISGTMSEGPGQVYLFYGDAAKGKGSACDITAAGCTARIGGLAKGDQTDSQQYEISYTTALSKRTLAYVGYTKINNSRNAAYTFDINPYAIAPGAKPAGLVGGMAHFF